MTSERLLPNVQDLQRDVIELLWQISVLMGRASTALSSDSAGNKYGELQQEVADAARNVENLALRMAIVAPMKAGKSTIINAIVGQELLPSRNAAMTTLPTEIIFDAERREPILTLSPQILTVFQETLLALKRKITALEGQAREKIAQYPHLVQLLERIQAMVVVSIPGEITGRERIVKSLADLNDIIRLCSVLEPLADPLGSMMEIPRIYTPFLRSETSEQSNKLGNLVIIDTPGPNEAGENLRLTNVVYEELKKSSLVLIVLDFTQLKNEAAEQVKKDVQKVVKLRGIENLYVLINKVDQRRKGDMTSEQVREFVTAELGLDDVERVFEVAARWAFSAANFLLELQQNQDIELDEMQTARVLAQEVFGIDWEEELEEATVEDLQKKAERLWKKSGFPPFLSSAIAALMERAAPRCIESALNIAHGRLVQLQEDVQLRSSAIAEDEEKLRLEVGALEADLHQLELCRTRLREVDKIKAQLYQKLNEILEALKKEAQVSIETFFSEAEYQRAGAFKKVGMEFGKLFNFLQGIEYKVTGKIYFDNLREAEEFTNLAVSYPQRRAEILLEAYREQIGEQIELSRQDLIQQLKKETQLIIESARKRLNKTFNLDLSLPTPTLKPVEMDFVKPQIEKDTRSVDQGYETIKIIKRREWYNWLWMLPLEETIQVKRPEKKEDYYTVFLPEIVEEVNQLIEQSIIRIKQEIAKYLDEDFHQRVDEFYNELERYLTDYRDSLMQTQSDQKLSLDMRSRLIGELNYIAASATEQIKNTDTYRKYTDDLMKS